MIARFVAAAALALGALAAPPAHAVPYVSVVVLGTVDSNMLALRATSFDTVPGEAYLITATGVVQPLLYTGPIGDGPSQYDCAWGFQAGSTAPRFAESLFRVDGQVAGCAGQAYSQTHTYQWTQLGTGHPFHFTVVTLVGGAVTFTVTGARPDVEHEIVSACAVQGIHTTALDYVPVVVDAQATATRRFPAESTFVVCDVSSASGESAHLAFGLPGPAVTTAARMTVPPGETLHICWYAGATWDDGIDVTTATQCVDVPV